MNEDWPGCLLKGYAPGVAVGMGTSEIVSAETIDVKATRPSSEGFMAVRLLA